MSPGLPVGRSASDLHRSLPRSEPRFRRPGTVLVLKGNKPLELRIHRRHRAVLYASDPAFLDAVLVDERG